MLVGDADGVVVIPAALLPAVIERLPLVRAAEQALQARLAGGLRQLDAVASLLAGDRVRYV